ncbi:MAG: fasciclin domain-containing protein, partial [Elainellaceae cyanobacterium]
PQDVPSSAISTGEVNTVAGSPLEVTVDGASVMVNNASVIQADIEASNGVIHAVDQVILPPDAQL